MKIQKLVIHNIASIEDATIDFEQNPLASSEVFLITGKTGSGKSTILDAICLALYADTPRLDTTKMQGKVNDVADEAIQIDDVRQLMRRNTGEAYTSLTFIGKNGIHYEAKWSIARANKKTNGKLQPRKWTLENLDKRYILKNVDEIKSEIKAAIGLDFHQFCRTTLLAQGDFTRFLNSEDNEKAAILEKITGVDIYSKIGKKVFAVTSSKKNEWEVANGLVKGMTTLSDKEIEERQQALVDLDNDYKKINGQKDDSARKRDWIQKDNELRESVNTAESVLREAMQITESDEFKKEEALTKEWNSTIEARGWLTEGKKAKTTQEAKEDALSKLSDKFAALLGGHQFAEQEAAKIQDEIQKLSKLLENEKDKAKVYEMSQTIAGHLNNIVNGRNVIETNSDNIKQKNKDLEDKLQPALDQAKRAEATARNAFNIQEAEVKAQEDEVEKLNLSQLRTQSNDFQDLIGKIGTAKERLEHLAKEQARMAKAEGELQKQLKSLEEKKLQSSQMEAPLHDAQLIMVAQKDALEKQKDSVNNFAKIWRAKLHLGDTCPVCRQKLTTELPHEDELSSLISGLEKSFKQAEQEYNTLNNSKVQIDAEIATDTTAYDRNKKAFDTDTSVETATANALEACKACGIETIDEGTSSSLNELEKGTAGSKKQLDAQIAEGEAKEKKAKQLRKNLDEQRKGLDDLKEKTTKADKEVNTCKNDINTAKALINSKKEEVLKEEEAVERLIGTTTWDNDWCTRTQEFADELTVATDTFNDRVEKRNQYRTEYDSANENCRNAAHVIEGILGLMPSWAEIQANPIAKIDKLLEQANSVNSDVAAITAELNTAKETRNRTRDLLSRFLQGHPDISLSRLEDLNRYTSDQITQKNSELENSRKDVATKSGALESVKKLHEEHQQNKPELTENDTIDLLDIDIEGFNKELKDITSKEGAIHQELAADKANKESLANLIADAESKKTAYQKWARLDNLIGDAQGNKFRKIAQSYVLANLIHSANHYMETLTSRYTLKVIPGTFIIMVEDAYQGFAARPASTISGGESFLVSLALALALSDIGNTLSVDTLFIDEGFGTLSGEPLQNAVNTLHTLQSHAGRHVGIISHVEELQERIPVQIRVEQSGNNSSSQIKVVP